MRHEFNGPHDEFAVGSVMGVRRYAVQVSPGKDHVYLKSPIRDDIWVDGTNTARCGLTTAWQIQDDAHKRYPGLARPASSFSLLHQYVAHPDCTCGYYSYFDGTIYPGGDISAVVEGFGRVTIGTSGFRTEKARIKAVCVKKPPRFKILDLVMTVVFTINLLFMFGAAVSNDADVMDWVILAVYATVVGVGGYFSFMTYKERLKVAPEISILPGLIQKDYPSVEVFSSYKKMISKYPPSTGGLAPMRNRPFRRWLHGWIYS